MYKVSIIINVLDARESITDQKVFVYRTKFWKRVKAFYNKIVCINDILFTQEYEK